MTHYPIVLGDTGASTISFCSCLCIIDNYTFLNQFNFFYKQIFFFSHFTQDYLLTVTSCLGEVSFLICYELRNQVSQNYIYWILRKRLRDSPKNKTHGFQWVSESFCFGFSSSFRLPDKRFPDK